MGKEQYRTKASSLAIRFVKQEMPLDLVRDAVDSATGGELDCTQLDIITDMVLSRMKNTLQTIGN